MIAAAVVNQVIVVHKKRTFFHTVLLLITLLGLTSCSSKQLYKTVVEHQRNSAGMQRRSVDLDFGEIVYLENNVKSDDTIVLVHGFGGSKDNWTKVIAEWHNKYHVVALDLPGNGESVATEILEYTTTHQAQMLDRFVKAKGLERFHLAGHSMGGAIVLRYMQNNSSNVDSLILIDAMGMVQTKSDGVKLVEISEKNPLYDVCTKERLETLINYSMYKVPTFFDIFKEPILEEKCHRKEIEKVMYEDLFKDVDLGSVAKIVQTPTLILWGEKDRMTHVDNAKLFHNTIKNSELVILKEVGHVPLLEAPKETADTIDNFIQKSKDNRVE